MKLKKSYLQKLGNKPITYKRDITNRDQKYTSFIINLLFLFEVCLNEVHVQVKLRSCLRFFQKRKVKRFKFNQHQR